MPRSIMSTILATSLSGFVLIISLLFSMPDQLRLFDADTVTGGSSAILQIVWDVFVVRQPTLMLHVHACVHALWERGEGLFTALVQGLCTFGAARGRHAVAAAKHFVWGRQANRAAGAHTLCIMARSVPHSTQRRVVLLRIRHLISHAVMAAWHAMAWRGRTRMAAGAARSRSCPSPSSPTSSASLRASQPTRACSTRSHATTACPSPRCSSACTRAHRCVRVCVRACVRACLCHGQSLQAAPCVLHCAACMHGSGVLHAMPCHALMVRLGAPLSWPDRPICDHAFLSKALSIIQSNARLVWSRAGWLAVQIQSIQFLPSWPGATTACCRPQCRRFWPWCC